MANNAITYGFMQLEDVYDRRVADLEPQKIDSAIFASADAYDRDMNKVLDELVEDTTQRDGAFELPTSGELQPLSEDGTPEVVQNFSEVAQGYPMWRGGDAFGFNREAYAKITVRDMDKAMLAVQQKQAKWTLRRAFAAFYTNASYTFKEKGRTDLTVRPLAITGDGEIYLDQNGDLTTANHFTFQAGAISNTANPFTANETVLRAHPGNTGTIVQYIPPDLVADTQALAGWYPYQPNNGLVSFGDGVDVAAASVGRFLGFGNEIVGVVSESVIVLSRRLPAGYVVARVEGVQKPLVRRREPEAQLQGLQVVPIQVDSNFRRFDFYLKEGYAVQNPVGMAVRQISAGSYTVPTGYDARTLAG